MKREWSIKFIFEQNLPPPNYHLPIQRQHIQLTFDCSIQRFSVHLSQRRILIPIFSCFSLSLKIQKIAFWEVCRSLLLLRIFLYFNNFWLLYLRFLIHHLFLGNICKKLMQSIFWKYFQHLEEIYWDAEIHAHYPGIRLLGTEHTNHSDVSARAERPLFRRFLHYLHITCSLKTI